MASGLRLRIQPVLQNPRRDVEALRHFELSQSLDGDAEEMDARGGHYETLAGPRESKQGSE